MTFLINVKGCTRLDKIKDEEIPKKAKELFSKWKRYEKDGLTDLNGREDGRLSKLVYFNIKK
jgi:hypothetical protein